MSNPLPFTIVMVICPSVLALVKVKLALPTSLTVLDGVPRPVVPQVPSSEEPRPVPSLLLQSPPVAEAVAVAVIPAAAVGVGAVVLAHVSMPAMSTAAGEDSEVAAKQAARPGMNLVFFMVFKFL